MTPHLALVPLTGFRVKEDEMLQWGMRLPGLTQRAAAIAELPALGLLTLAGMTPEPWTCSYHPALSVTEELVEQVASRRPTLVAISALTASVDEAYRLSLALRARSIRTVIGGLHATACPEEARPFCDAVVVGDGEPVWHQVLADGFANQLAPRYQAAPTSEFRWCRPRIDLLGALPPRFTLQTQRGCPLHCEFCGASRLLGSFREKPIELIREELAAICSISPKPLLELADDNNMDSERFDRYLQVLERLPMNTPFGVGQQEALENQLSKYSKRTEEQQARLRKLMLERKLLPGDESKGQEP